MEVLDRYAHEFDATFYLTHVVDELGPEDHELGTLLGIKNSDLSYLGNDLQPGTTGNSKRRVSEVLKIFRESKDKKLRDLYEALDKRLKKGRIAQNMEKAANDFINERDRQSNADTTDGQQEQQADGTVEYEQTAATGTGTNGTTQTHVYQIEEGESLR